MIKVKTFYTSNFYKINLSSQNNNHIFEKHQDLEGYSVVIDPDKRMF